MAFLGDLSQLMPFLGDFVSQLWHFFGNLEARAGRSTTTCGLLTPEPQRTQTAARKTVAHASSAEAEADSAGSSGSGDDGGVNGGDGGVPGTSRQNA